MNILHHGAVNGVTGSCYELRYTGVPLAGSDRKGKGDRPQIETADVGILIDCGLFQGAEVSGSGQSHA